jgi:hypothetical protein
MSVKLLTIPKIKDRFIRDQMLVPFASLTGTTLPSQRKRPWRTRLRLNARKEAAGTTLKITRAGRTIANTLFPSQVRPASPGTFLASVGRAVWCVVVQ